MLLITFSTPSICLDNLFRGGFERRSCHLSIQLHLTAVDAKGKIVKHTVVREHDKLVPYFLHEGLLRARQSRPALRLCGRCRCYGQCQQQSDSSRCLYVRAMTEIEPARSITDILICSWRRLSGLRDIGSAVGLPLNRQG